MCTQQQWALQVTPVGFLPIKTLLIKNNKKREAALKNEAGGDKKHVVFFLLGVTLNDQSINQSSLLSYVRHGCPLARARGSCLKRKTIKLSMNKTM